MLTITEMEARLAEIKAYAGVAAPERKDYQNIQRQLEHYQETTIHNDIEYGIDIPVNFRAKTMDGQTVVYGFYRAQTIHDGDTPFRVHYIISNNGFRQWQIDPGSLEMMTHLGNENNVMWTRVMRREDKQPMPFYSYYNDRNGREGQPTYNTESKWMVPIENRHQSHQQEHYQQKFAKKYEPKTLTEIKQQAGDEVFNRAHPTYNKKSFR